MGVTKNNFDFNSRVFQNVIHEEENSAQTGEWNFKSRVPDRDSNQ